jgi:hypothetical protein
MLMPRTLCNSEERKRGNPFGEIGFPRRAIVSVRAKSAAQAAGSSGAGGT